MVYLNGKRVSPDTIDPGKHKFIGMFRPAVDPTTTTDCAIICSCGQTLWLVNEGREHYLKGCYDVPQYIDLD